MPTQPDTFDPKDHKSKQTLRAEQKKERQQEALKQKTHAKELRQLIKQAAKNHKEKKRADRKHIKEIYVKLKQETKANLSKAKASHNPKEAMDEFHKQQTSDKLRNNLLVKQIKLETRTEYVKNLRQIDEAYPDLRRKQWSFKVKKWFFGVGKEFSRVRWIDRQKLIKDFVIILIIVAILALLFLGLDLAILKWT